MIENIKNIIKKLITNPKEYQVGCSIYHNGSLEGDGIYIEFKPQFSDHYYNICIGYDRKIVYNYLGFYNSFQCTERDYKELELLYLDLKQKLADVADDIFKHIFE